MCGSERVARGRRPWRTIAGLVMALFLGVLAGFAPAGPALAADAEAEANRQFVQAVLAIRRAEQSFDAAESAQLLREADRLLADIVTRLPESGLAVLLVTNQFIGDFDYADFKTRMRGLACSEPQSTGCLLHRIELLMTPVEYPIVAARWDWLSLAVAHHVLAERGGDAGRVRPIVGPFLAAVRGPAVPMEASEDLFVGRALAMIGEVDRALELTRSISTCSARLYNLKDITRVLADRNEMARAAQVADEASEFARARGCSWELGLVAQALLKGGLESRARTLFLNTVEEQFSRFKERRGICCPPELAVAAGDLGDSNLALGLLRTVQEESPWTVPQVLGRLGARGQTTLALAYADQLGDTELKAQSYVELVAGAIRGGDAKAAGLVAERLEALAAEHGSDPLVLIQMARNDWLLHNDGRWRGRFQAALDAAEAAPADMQRRDIATPFLAALVQIETGVAMLD